MPLVGHCLWKIPNEKIADHVYNAIKAGYHLFDGACGEPTITFKEASLTLFQTAETKWKQAKALQEQSKTA
jgi:hypothetical protein